MMQRAEAVGHKAIGTVLLQADNPDRIVANADFWAWIDEKGKLRTASSREFAAFVAGVVRRMDPERYRQAGMTVVRHCNAYVNTGLNNALDLEFGIGSPTAVGYIGVSSNTTAVTASTVNLNGASGGSAANTIIKAISPTETRTAQTVTGGATFANADFTSGVFVQNKIGFLNTSTDAGTGLIDVIGGTGGSAPYNRTFSLDLTNAGTFSETAQIADTASAA